MVTEAAVVAVEVAALGFRRFRAVVAVADREVEVAAVDSPVSVVHQVAAELKPSDTACSFR